MNSNYRYKAIDRNGRLIEGAIDAESEALVTAHLHREGALPIQIESHHLGDERSRPNDFLAKLDSIIRRPQFRLRDLSDWCEQLSTLLSAGLSLDAALTVMSQGSSSIRIRDLTINVQVDIRQGLSLSAALSHYSNAFPPVFLPMIQAAELSGAMPTALSALGDDLAYANSTREALISALAYPMTLLVVGVLSMLVVVTVVLPALATMFEDMDATLPVITQIVLGMGKFIRQWSWALILLILSLVLLGMAWIRHERNVRRWDSWMLRLPLLGQIRRAGMAARFSRIMGMLLHHGVTIDRALPIATKGLSNTKVRQHMERASESLKRGNGLSKTLINSEIFGQDALQLLRIGEEAGTLAEMLKRIAVRYEQRMQQRIAALVRLLEPALILGLASLIGIVVISLLMAILSINDIAI